VEPTSAPVTPAAIAEPASPAGTLSAAGVALLPVCTLAGAIGWAAAGSGSPWLGRVAMAVVIASALATVALGTRRARHDHARLKALVGAVRRVASRDFSAGPPVGGRDLLGELGRGLAAMTRGLGMHFVSLRTLSQIDRSILAQPDPAEVVKLAMPCLAYVAESDALVLALVDDEAPALMRFHVLRARNLTRIERNRLPATGDWATRVASHQGTSWDGVLPLPAAIMAQLRAECGEGGTALVLRIGARETPRGFAVFAYGNSRTLAPDQSELLQDLLARVDAACIAAERLPDPTSAAHLDTLTGLPNRPALVSALQSELAHAQRNRSRVAVLVLDLDRFKQTNDTLGHVAGDELLRSAADRIRRTIREEDTVARHGGDEFAILVSGLISGRDSGASARNLIKVLSRPFDIGGETVYIGASVGISIYPDDGTDAEDLIKKADTAMYRAKDEGRSRFAYYEESMNIETRRRVALDRELRQALERGEFVLHFQPQLEVRTGRICTVEALVRWQHPEQGLLAPSAFIPFAEENGLIDAIGSWVIREACMQFRRWRADGLGIPRIAVNVSIEQLRRSNFVRTVEHALQMAEMPRETLEIEVTESMFLQRGKAAMNAMNELSQAGVVFAIDDFGSGYASFSYLKTLHAQVVKLDQMFIADAAINADAGTIVAAMINMAHTLKKEVVAEGVENRAQLDFLVKLGCEKVQGYLFSRPLPADEFVRFARDHIEHNPPSVSSLAPFGGSSRRPRAEAPSPSQDEWLTVPFVDAEH